MRGQTDRRSLQMEPQGSAPNHPHYHELRYTLFQEARPFDLIPGLSLLSRASEREWIASTSTISYESILVVESKCSHRYWLRNRVGTLTNITTALCSSLALARTKRNEIESMVADTTTDASAVAAAAAAALTSTTTTTNVDAVAAVAQAALEQQQQLQQQQQQPPPPLPPGWVRKESRSQPNYYYYFHQETGQCVWDRPQSMESQALHDEKVEEETATTFDTATTKATTSKHTHHKRSLPDNDTHAAASTTPTTTTTTTTTSTSKRSKTSTTNNSSNNNSSSKEPSKVRILHILKKHAQSRRPSSWRQKTITLSLEDAKEELQELLDMLLEEQQQGASLAELRATFEELARTESDCSSAKRGGDLGFFARGKMQPPFERASFALSVGELSQTLVETSSGVHILLRIG